MVEKNPLEKEMATHSSVLAWEVPWTEQPGRLQVSVLGQVIVLFHLYSSPGRQNDFADVEADLQSCSPMF